MELLFENETDFCFDDEYLNIVVNVINEALSSENVGDKFEVSFTLTNAERIREVNKKFRGIDSVTDVLSFPLIQFPYQNNSSHNAAIGDIMICIERAKSQAEEYGHSLMREIAFLTAHSMLHLLGYDHIEPNEEKEMFAKQEKILDKLGYTRDFPKGKR